MNTAPHLRPEDHSDFERVLNEALRADVIHQALQAPGARLNIEQLRTRALTADDVITAVAAEEYGSYTALRERARATATAAHIGRGEAGEPGGLPGAAARSPADAGAGAIPVMTVLAPILAGAAAAIFLLLGYGLRITDPHLDFADSLITAGWVSLAVGVLALVAGIVGLLLTAVRNGATLPDGQDPELYAELATARDAWKAALKDRGMMPYLLAQLPVAPADSTAAPAAATGVDLTRGRPRLGFTSPNYTSPGPEPDLDGNRPRRPHATPFTSPEYSSPSFTSPDFTSPGRKSPDRDAHDPGQP